jgi:NAD(P)-dependent dehydrogenase (short-subunit alcohol dehydrogenase family)
MLLDLDSLDSVRAFVAAWEKGKRPLHMLINNAGVFHMGGGRGGGRIVHGGGSQGAALCSWRGALST